jgi:hypothetical protein
LLPHFMFIDDGNSKRQAASTWEFPLSLDVNERKKLSISRYNSCDFEWRNVKEW